MAGLLRFLFGFALLPTCWAIARVLVEVVINAAEAEGAVNAESISFLGGLTAFAFSWVFLPHPVKTYVFGHELTHALWGILFGARVGRVRVGASGGSVNLSKTNVFITLAPYFFPFYTFIILVIACIVNHFAHPLPWMPMWMFLVGFTWAFHILFTLETLAHRQPDVKLYGRLFSWTFIFLANALIILLGLVGMTSLTFSELGCLMLSQLASVYRDILSLFMHVACLLHS